MPQSFSHGAYTLLVKKSYAGLGLFAGEPIPKRKKIIEYVGERITPAEADRRGGKYLFEVSNRTTIDGKGRHNLARYINHSCDPNCETEIDRGHVFVWSVKPIQSGEELTYDYGKEYFDEFLAPTGCKCASCRAKQTIS